MLFVVVVLLMQWSHEDERAAARYDPHAARDDDAELREYNDMLSQLSPRRG